MPRLTSRDYLLQRRYLCSIWENDEGGSFAVLPGQQQRDLHDYYAPSGHLTEQQALTHRTAISKAFPSLPQSAGRSFNALRDHLDGKPNQIVDSHLRRRTTSEKIGGKQRTVRTLSVSRPKIDHRRLARALLDHALVEFDRSLSTREKTFVRRRKKNSLDE